MAKKPVDLLPGTLDLLILKAVSPADIHGYGVLLREEEAGWHRLVAAMAAALTAAPQEI